MCGKLNCSNDLCLSQGIVLWALNEKTSQPYFPAIIYVSFLMVSGLFGNGIVLYLYHCKFKSSTANILIKGLAVFDLMCCTIGMPYEIMDMRFNFVYANAVACKLLRMLEMYFNVASGLTIICIAFDRYYHVCRPLSVFTKGKGHRLLVATTVVSALITWPCVVVFGLKTSTTDVQDVFAVSCSIDESLIDTVFPLMFYLWLSAVNIAAAISLFVLYSLMGTTIARWRKTPFCQRAGLPVSKRKVAIPEGRKEVEIKDVSLARIPVGSKVTGSVADAVKKSEENVATMGAVSLEEIVPRTKDDSRGKVEVFCVDLKRNEGNQAVGVYYERASPRRFVKENLRGSVKPSEDTDMKQRFSVTAITRGLVVSRTTVMLTVVTVVFVISYTPNVVIELLMRLGLVDLSQFSLPARYAWEIIDKTYFISNAVNPFIYAAFQPKFRHELAELFRYHRRLR